MHTLKLAEIPSDSLINISTQFRLQNIKLSSSIQDIGKLLRLDCLQEQQLNQTSPQFHHRRFKTGERIYYLGQKFESLYIVRFGFLKTVLRNADGEERVLSFPMKGNLLGFDGICNNRYGTESIALTDCELIVVPFKKLLTAIHSCQELEQMIYVAISRELMGEHTGVGLPSSLKSEARVAHFLESIIKRYAALGYSSKEILLPMTRRDIGSHLGLTLETVSRALSTLAAAGAIDVHRKNIRILDLESLHLFQSSLALSQHRNQPIQSLVFARSPQP